MSILYPNGIGASTGDSLVLSKPLLTSGNVWYVDSATGTDAVSPAGRNREKPLATLAQAVTNSADDDIIVFLDGHAQTLTAVQVISKRLTLVGEGSSAGVPTVTFTNNQASTGGLFTASGASLQFRNIKFAKSIETSGNATARVTCSAAGVHFKGCYFECGPYDNGPAVLLAAGADNATFDNCAFISTATLLTAQPESALKSSAAIAGLTIQNTSFSAGTVGFSNYYAVDLSGGAVTLMRCEGVSLLLGSDVFLHASSTGYFNPQLSTGGSRIAW